MDYSYDDLEMQRNLQHSIPVDISDDPPVPPPPTDIKLLDINTNIFVYHTFVIKSINDHNDQLRLIVTGIQKCLIPHIHETELNNRLQFAYRINDDATTNDFITERKTKTVKIINNDVDKSLKCNIATVTTNAMSLPLCITMILNHFPFRLYKASVKIELTSRQVDTNEKSHITLRPCFVSEDKTNYQNLIRVNNKDKNAISHKQQYDKLLDTMDKTTKYDIVSPIPFIYGVRQTKTIQNSSEIIEYTPIVEIGFYLYEPILDTFFNMISPLFMVILLLTSTISINMDETNYLGIMCGIILAVVFVMKNMRRSTTITKISTTDLYIICFLSGLTICIGGVFHPYAKIIGVSISWGSNIIPLIGYYKYKQITNKITKKSNEYNDIIQNPGKIVFSKEEISYDKLFDIPTKKKPWGYVHP